MNRDIETLSTDPKYKKLVEVPRKEWDQWKESWGPSQNIKNFFSEQDLEWLTDMMYKNHHKRRVKKNGTLHFMCDMDVIKEKFFDRIQQTVPYIEDSPWRGNFFITSTPYNLHTDTGTPDAYKNLVPGKQLIIPLFICWGGHHDKPEDWHPECGTMVFKNRFIMYGSNFAKSDSEYDTNVNFTIRDYTSLQCFDIDGKQMSIDWDKGIGKENYQKYFTHFNHKWLEGFEMEKFLDWRRGNLLAFDMAQAHCGINFLKHQVNLKAGLTIMTTRKKYE